jgi:hypothetical protein
MGGLEYKPDESFARTWKWSGRVMGAVGLVAFVMLWHARLSGNTKTERWLWPAQRAALESERLKAAAGTEQAVIGDAASAAAAATNLVPVDATKTTNGVMR